MDESNIDLYAYALGESGPDARRAAERLLAESPEAREEFERLQLTFAALHSVRDEELPRRIAFVSDPVFEPKWWEKIWSSISTPGFAGAALLAVAIASHGYLTQPKLQFVSQPAPQVAQIDQAGIDLAVAKAVAAVELRHKNSNAEQLRAALSEVEKRNANERQMMAIGFEENLNYIRKQMNRMIVTNAGLTVGGTQQ